MTIEDVLVLGEDIILAADDNNYPFSNGRGPDVDNSEIIIFKVVGRNFDYRGVRADLAQPGDRSLV